VLLFRRRRKQEELWPEEQFRQPEAAETESTEAEEYELVEREILPAKIICPDCGGITLEGLDFCDKCGGEL
jgi:hypothetical protein